MEEISVKLVIIGNVLALLGSLIMIAVGFIKEKKHILIVQCVQFGLMGAGNIFLGGLTGGIANAVSILRNVLCLYLPFTTPWKIVFIAFQSIWTLAVNTEGAAGWLPVFAACVYTLSLSTKDERVLKAVMIMGQLAWTAYDVTIKNYSAFVFDILTIASNITGIWMLTRDRKKAAPASASKDAPDGENGPYKHRSTRQKLNNGKK